MDTPFTPQGTTATLSVTNVTGRVALTRKPTSAPDLVVLLTNEGPDKVYFKVGDVTVTAAVTDTPLLPGAVLGILVNNQTPGDATEEPPYIAAITASGTATLKATPGTGTPYMGGVSLVGTSGDPTEVDGTATPSDAFANPTNAVTTWALSGLWDGTQWLRQRGTANGAYSQGSVASGAADAGNPLKIGAVYNTTLPTFTNGQRGDLQMGTRGSLHTEIFANDGITPANVGNPADGRTAVSALAVWGENGLYNGTNWDRFYTLQGAANSGLGTAAFGLTKLSGTQLTKVTVNISTATTTSIVSGTASQNVRVYKVVLNIAAAQTIDVQGSGGTSLVGGALSYGANGQLVLDFDGEPWWTTPTAEGLQFVTTTTGVVRGTVYYIKGA